jgi:hypothetical protein
MIILLFKEFLSFFNKSFLGGMSFNNQHLLILNGHGSHVTLETIEHSKDFGLDMITLASHTSHTLQPLKMSYFKPFKTTFRKFRGASRSRSNHMELSKINLVGWVDQALK